MRQQFFIRASYIALIVAIGGIATSNAQAQGFFGSLEGRYVFVGKSQFDALDQFPNGNPTLNLGSSVQPDNGWGGRLFMGYRFGNNWDLGVGGSGAWLGSDKSRADNGQPPAPGGSPEHENLKVKGHQWNVDLEGGYNVGIADMGANLRLFGGLRYARIEQAGSGHYDGQFPLGGNIFQTNDYNSKSNYWGIGPRIGAQADVPFGKQANFGVSFAIAGSVLFGHMNSSLTGTNHFERIGIPDTALDTPLDQHDKGSKTVYNAEGEIGLWYALTPGFKVTAGYRAEGWFNAIGDISNQSNDRVLSGPFVRASFNFGAPPAAPMGMAPPPVQPAMAKKNFIVFFDFDRSNITTDAQKIINDAAATAKAGNATQVSVTGHTDRSGSEQYNMALSLRRAEAVKASLIKLGVPASLIVVVGKGESQPLVNTPDGVREPQNRRVEIVI